MGFLAEENRYLASTNRAGMKSLPISILESNESRDRLVVDLQRAIPEQAMSGRRSGVRLTHVRKQQVEHCTEPYVTQNVSTPRKKE